MVDFAKHLKSPLGKETFDTLLGMDMRETVFRDTPRPWKVVQTSQLIAEASDGHVVYTGDGFRIVDTDGHGIVSFHNQTATNLARAQAIVNCVNEVERKKHDDYDQLYAALEDCDTNQIMQERDALRLRIKAVDEELEQIKADREKIIQAYTAVETDRNLWRAQAEANSKERDFYFKAWEQRGKRLAMWANREIKIRQGMTT